MEKDDGLIKQFFFLSPKMLSYVFTHGAMPKNGRLLTPNVRCLDVWKHVLSPAQASAICFLLTYLRIDSRYVNKERKGHRWHHSALALYSRDKLEVDQTFVMRALFELTVYLRKVFDCNHSVYDFIYIFKTHMYSIKKNENIFAIKIH